MSWPDLIPPELDAALSRLPADFPPDAVYDVFLAWCQVVQLAAPCIKLSAPEDLSVGLASVPKTTDGGSTQVLWAQLKAWLHHNEVQAPPRIAARDSA